MPELYLSRVKLLQSHRLDLVVLATDLSNPHFKHVWRKSDGRLLPEKRPYRVSNFILCEAMPREHQIFSGQYGYVRHQAPSLHKYAT